jgi:hypothetical protein
VPAAKLFESGNKVILVIAAVFDHKPAVKNKKVETELSSLTDVEETDLFVLAA